MMTDRHYHLFDTGLGVCGLAWSEAGLARVALPAARRDAVAASAAGETGVAWSGPLPDMIADCAERIRRHVSGVAVDYRDVALDLATTSPFHGRVYAALREVGWGTTTTYGALAETVGEPGAARAIGVAMGRNPWPIVVPCHRVLAAGRRLGGFSAPGGTLTKEVLLAREGVTVGDGTPLLPGLLPGIG